MSLFGLFNLGKGFREHFRIDAALDNTLREDVYRIRHEVYCEELRFEPERADRREIDTFDAHSLHCLLRRVAEPHTLVGCARLVLTDPKDPDAPLPFERTCAGALDPRIVDTAALRRDRIAEVSRLAVRAPFRRRKGEDRVAASISNEDFGSATQPRFPYIPIGLYLGAISLAVHKDIETLFVLTEPRLASHFSKLGVDIRQIGAPISHRGVRVPSMMDVNSIIRNMRSLMRPFWRAVHEEIGRGFEKP